MRAAYDAIYRDLRDSIEKGHYKFEEFLPSETELVKRYDCAHNTVRRAISMLSDQGYVLPVHGKGVRVIYQPRDRTLLEMGGIETFAEAAQREHLKVSTTILAMGHIQVSPEFSLVSGFASGTELLHLERIRTVMGRALIHDINYFRADAVEGLSANQAAESVYEYVEDTKGIKVAIAKRQVTVERPTFVDRENLDIEGVGFLAVVTSQTFDGNGLLFEYTQSRHHPDYFSFYDTANRTHVRQR